MCVCVFRHRLSLCGHHVCVCSGSDCLYVVITCTRVVTHLNTGATNSALFWFSFCDCLAWSLLMRAEPLWCLVSWVDPCVMCPRARRCGFRPGRKTIVRGVLRSLVLERAIGEPSDGIPSSSCKHLPHSSLFCRAIESHSSLWFRYVNTVSTGSLP